MTQNYGEIIAAHYRKANNRNREVSERLDSQWTKDRIGSIIAEREAIAALVSAADVPGASRAVIGALIGLAKALELETMP